MSTEIISALDKLNKTSEALGYGKVLQQDNKREYLTFSVNLMHDEKRMIDIEAKSNTNTFTIVFVGDLHKGHRAANGALIDATFEYIERKRNSAAIFLGDQLENANKVSVGAGVFEQDMSPVEQSIWFAKRLKSIAKKTWGVHPGNHEERGRNFDSDDKIKIICDTLNINYLGYQAFFKIRFGEQTYIIMTGHGTGGGSTPGGKVNASHKMSSIATGIDIYASGHGHMPHHHSTIRFQPDPDSGLMVPRKETYITVPSYLSYWSTYAEMKMHQPLPIGFTEVVIRKDAKNFMVFSE